MRILYALDSYRPNIDGVGISIERQARGLVDRGHEAALIVPAYGDTELEEWHGPLRVIRVPAARLIHTQWRLAVIPSEIIENAFASFQPDAVVVCLPFPLGLRMLRAAHRRGLPVVGITGTMPEWLLYSLGWLRPVLQGFYDRLWGILTAFYNRCDVVVGVTQTALGYLSDHGLRRPTTVISNGVDLDAFRPRQRDAILASTLGLPDRPTVLYTGRLDREKRIGVLIEAFGILRRRVDAHLIVGGEGSERAKLRALVDQLGLAQNVTFAGFLPNEEYPFVYSLADVFAIASPAELQSIVTLEAAASGLPIVAANAGALPELVKHGHNGYLFPQGDAEGLARGLASILTDRDADLTFGSRSRQIAERHDIHESIAAYEHLYQQLLCPARSLAA